MSKKSQKEILIVDDSKVCRALLSKNFERLGYKVSIAHNGQEALDLINDRLPDYSFEVIISDWEIPIMDGKTFIKVCRSSYPSYENTCIILISSQQVNDFKEANYFFLKPIAPLQIQSQIELFWQNEQIVLLEHVEEVELTGEDSI